MFRKFLGLTLLVVFMPVRGVTAVVYQSDFQSGSTSSWSSNSLFTDDAGRRVLGTFETTSVTLSIPSLPAGPASVSFDLFIINSWDGNGAFFSGPNTFRFAINGVDQVNAAFSNALRVEQTYSNATPFGGGPFLGGTDRASSGDLAIVRDAPIPNDRYRLSFNFAHSGGPAVFTFTGSGGQDGQMYLGFLDEPWALDDVRVEGVPEPGNGIFLVTSSILLMRRRLRVTFVS